MIKERNNEVLSPLVNETNYGAYIGLNPYTESKLKIIQKPNFDVIEFGSVRVILSKASRYSGDDFGEIFGINFYRKLPTFEEAINYWSKLPQALALTDFTGNLAFAASDEADYNRKIAVYNAFYSFVFDNDKEKKIIICAPHSGDIRYSPDNIKSNPQNDIDRWSARVTALCLDRLHNFTWKKKTVCFIHTSGDHFKSYPAVIDCGDMGTKISGVNGVIELLNRFYKKELQSHISGYVANIQHRTLPLCQKVQKKYGTSDIEILKKKIEDFSLKKTVERFFDYKLTFEEFSQINPDELAKRLLKAELLEKENLADAKSPSIIGNYVFSGKKIAGQIDINNKMKAGFVDQCMQFECSEYYLKEATELIAEIISKFLIETDKL